MIDLGDTNRRNTEITQLLIGARRLIESGVVSLRAASDKIAEAENQGATQREIAKAVGKSVGWVNGLLKWRKLGYPSETPFGPSSKASRSRARVQSPERRSPIEKFDSSIELEGTCGSGTSIRTIEHGIDTKKIANGAATLREALPTKKPAVDETATTKQPHPSGHEFDRNHRDRLVEILAMLGSVNVRQRDHAARQADQLRKKLKMTWNDLIVVANEHACSEVDA